MLEEDMATITTDVWTLLYGIKPGSSEFHNLKDDPQAGTQYQHKHQFTKVTNSSTTLSIIDGASDESVTIPTWISWGCKP